MVGHAVEPDRAGAAVALVASLLDAEEAKPAQEGPEALSRRRLRREGLAVHGEIHAATPLLELGTNLLGVIIGEPPPIGRRAMHVIEIAVGGNSLVDGVAKLGGRRHAVEFDLHRPRRCRGDGEQQIGIVGAPRADEKHGGAAEMGQRGAMRGEALMERAGGDMDVAQELARLQHVGVVAGDEVDRRHFARAPSRGRSV